MKDGKQMCLSQGLRTSTSSLREQTGSAFSVMPTLLFLFYTWGLFTAPLKINKEKHIALNLFQRIGAWPGSGGRVLGERCPVPSPCRGRGGHRASVGSAQDWTSWYAARGLAEHSLSERTTERTSRRRPRTKRTTKAARAPLGSRLRPKK